MMRLQRKNDFYTFDSASLGHKSKKLYCIDRVLLEI